MTPVKRRRVSSDDDRGADPSSSLCVASSSSSSSSCSSSVVPSCSEPKPDHQEALTPTSTSDTETRDSSSLIDPGTEQDPPSPDPVPASSTNLDSSPKEEKMDSSSSCSSSSLLQEATEEQEGGVGDAVMTSCSSELERPVEGEVAAAKSERGDEAPPLSEDTPLPSGLGLVGEESDVHTPNSAQTSGSSALSVDTLDMLYRTVEATIAIVSKLSVQGPPSS